MLWKLERVDHALIDAFEHAGEPDQEVIAAYLQQRSHRPQQPPKHDGIKRWYYLLRDNPRVRLATVGRPLDDWDGSAKMIVGVNEIIGEFPKNRPYVGMRGLQLQCQPIAWLTGTADLEIADGTALLAEISEQILDKRAIDNIQQRIAQRYQWRG